MQQMNLIYGAICCPVQQWLPALLYSMYVINKGMFAHSLVLRYCTSTTAPIKVDNQAGQELQRIEHD